MERLYVKEQKKHQNSPINGKTSANLMLQHLEMQSSSQSPLVQEVLTSTGNQLDPDTCKVMEAKFHHDFNNIRVHNDEKAAISATSVNALAYALGHNIVFAAGQYSPSTEEGLNLLEHELTHVIEQENSYERMQLAAPSSKVSALKAPQFIKAYQFKIDGKTITLNEEEYNREKARLLRNLNTNFKLLEQEANYNQQDHKNFLDKTHGWVGVISDILGKTVPPSPGIWTWCQPAIHAGKKALSEGRLDAAGIQLRLAQSSLRDANIAWKTYLDKTAGGAGKAVKALEFTRDISFSIAIGTAAVVAAPVVAGFLAGGGAIGAGSAIGTGVVVTAGGGTAGAALRGGTSMAGQVLAGEKVSGAQVWRETEEGFKRGAVDAATAVVGLGAGKALRIGAEGAKLAKVTRAGRAARLAKEAAKSSVAGAASGGTGGALEATMEGKKPSEILEAAGKGAIAGGAGGAVGGVSGTLSKGKSALRRVVVETVGEAGGGAASALITGGSKEDIKKAVITSIISGRATAAAQPPQIGSRKIREQQSTEPLVASPKEPITPTRIASAQKVKYGEIELLQGEGSLELDLSGSQKGWNKPHEDFQVIDPSMINAEIKKPTFGEPSTEKAGTGYHTGMHFHEYSAAEIAVNLRVDWDPQAARPRQVSYIFTSEAAAVGSQATKRSFHEEGRLKGESAQSKASAYVKSGFERGHLAQREAGKVDPAFDAALGLKSTGREVERSLDVLTNVVPMTPQLNKGTAWRSAETRTANFARTEGYVIVEITPIYDAIPTRLRDGTPIPSSFRRVIKSGATGRILEDLSFQNLPI